MRHPEGDSGEVGVDVAAGWDMGFAREEECYAAGFAGEGFDDDSGHAVAAGDVEIDQSCESRASFKRPHADHELEPGFLGQVVEVDVEIDAQDGHQGEELVEMQKGFVKGMSDRRRGVQEKENHEQGADEPPEEEWIGLHIGPSLVPSCSIDGVDRPCDGVSDGLQHHDSTQPAVDEVVCVEADVQQWNERIIPSRQENQRYHIQHGQISRPASELGNKRRLLVHAVVEDTAVRDLADQVQSQQSRVESRRQRSNIYGRREHDLAVVSLPPQRRIENMLLYLRPQRALDFPHSLLFSAGDG